MSSTWFTSEEILPEHNKLPIKQIYVWFVTSDDKIVIVGNGKGKFQFPGGKPEEGESKLETMSRELFEEAGLKLEQFDSKPVMFGYYLIENDPNWPDAPQYLQLRYYHFVSQSSDKISLSINERLEDKDQMQKVKFVNLEILTEFIPWTKDLPEFIDLMTIRSSL